MYACPLRLDNRFVGRGPCSSQMLLRSMDWLQDLRWAAIAISTPMPTPGGSRALAGQCAKATCPRFGSTDSLGRLCEFALAPARRPSCASSEWHARSAGFGGNGRCELPARRLPLDSAERMPAVQRLPSLNLASRRSVLQRVLSFARRDQMTASIAITVIAAPPCRRQLATDAVHDCPVVHACAEWQGYAISLGH
jgi:hypothetical protein